MKLEGTKQKAESIYKKNNLFRRRITTTTSPVSNGPTEFFFDEELTTCSITRMGCYVIIHIFSYNVNETSRLGSRGLLHFHTFELSWL